MNTDIKIKLATTAVEIIFSKGLPAVLSLFTELNKKELVTLEDIKSVRSNLDSQDWFQPRE